MGITGRTIVACMEMQFVSIPAKLQAQLYKE